MAVVITKDIVKVVAGKTPAKKVAPSRAKKSKKRD